MRETSRLSHLLFDSIFIRLRGCFGWMDRWKQELVGMRKNEGCNSDSMRKNGKNRGRDRRRKEGWRFIECTQRVKWEQSFCYPTIPVWLSSSLSLFFTLLTLVTLRLISLGYPLSIHLSLNTLVSSAPFAFLSSQLFSTLTHPLQLSFSIVQSHIFQNKRKKCKEKVKRS